MKFSNGQSTEAVKLLERAMRLDPFHFKWITALLGWSYTNLDQYDKATKVFESLLASPNANRWTRRAPFEALTVISVFRNDLARARQNREKLQEVWPEANVSAMTREVLLLKDKAYAHRYLDALRKAGLPEKPPSTEPEKPSIAVLPFANMSTDKEQEFFADGISEDLTTQLSKISALLVISRTSAFKYKGQSIDVREIVRALGVRYVLEGSVRRGGDQLRINAQLIEATTGGHLWAESYDGMAGEIFSLQDRINRDIVEALKVRLTAQEQTRVVDRGTDNLKAYDSFLRGERLRLYSRGEVFDKAVLEYEEAIRLDPNFAAAHAGLGHLTLNWAYMVIIWKIPGRFRIAP